MTESPIERSITRLLIANRGEIARRILRSAHDMGISTVAVYADGDAGAPFVREADQAIALRGRSSAETYLDAEKLLEAARRTGADAIHPGYGFLAENAEFARRVEAAGLVWVGPSPAAIAAMGDKLSAKKRMQEAGVPTLPAAELEAGESAVEKARAIGYPLLVKASAGGGGKGMRVVESEEELDAAVDGARRESAAAFGDDTVFLERWLPASRHVEIQLLGDQHGTLLHCFERECSIQRRHQKIIEEAPSPVVGEELRARMGEAAVAAGKAIDYSSAGTVEFLLEDGSEDFWFLEVNTRLQVEHPVTEEITGLDLVREQLRIAQGEPLGFTQEDLSIDGHAIEARLYAEDPSTGFLPATGRVLAWEPSATARARFDSGIEAGDEIGIEFDPMIAKVIVHAPTRREAASRLARVLETTRVQGVVTNRDFLVATLRRPEFLAGDTTTDFLERVKPERTRSRSRAEIVDAVLFAAMAAQHDRRARARVLGTVASGWRNTVMPREEVVYRVGEVEYQVAYRRRRDGAFDVEVTGPTADGFNEGRAPGAEISEHVVEVVRREEDGITLVVDGRRIAGAAGVERVGVDRFRCLVHSPGGDVELEQQPRFPAAGGEGVAGGLVAPMPAKVISTHVTVGDAVVAGQLLMVLEAMKMEQRITAPAAGSVSELRVAAGDQVANGELLVVLSEESDGSPGSTGDESAGGKE